VADPRRPDPSKGVFETLLVLDGRPVELDAHLARLEASLAELFSAHAAPDLRETIEDRAQEIEAGSVRAAVAPVGADDRAELRAEVESRHALGPLFPLSGHKGPVRKVQLCSLALYGGLGPHKWADRTLLDEAQSSLGADALPLIVDAGGTVLEASRANVFAVRNGTLFTPPTDGRILSGVTRMRVLEIAGAMDIDLREEPLTRNDLLSADDVFLTGSVRGIENVDSLDGAPIHDGSEITECLATELWQTWARAKTALRFASSGPR
jgi:para-aminobenzoate synthetase/4-amino-4-deoxychorismate lyase